MLVFNNAEETTDSGRSMCWVWPRCPVTSLKGPQKVGTVCIQLFGVSRTVTTQSVPALVLSLWMWALLWLGDFADVVILQLLN